MTKHHAVPDNPTEESAKDTLDQTVGPFCRNCLHCRLPDGYDPARPESYSCATCAVVMFETIDLVSGEPIKEQANCHSARSGFCEECGPEGKAFKPKPPAVSVIDVGNKPPAEQMAILDNWIKETKP
jgi:hypothetical protein